MARGAPEEFQAVRVLYQANFSLVKEDGEWLIDGFNFDGSPPPEVGTPVVGIDAVEFGFILDTPDFGRDAAFKLTNAGKQQHELVIYKGPDNGDIGTAKTALENATAPSSPTSRPGTRSITSDSRSRVKLSISRSPNRSPRGPSSLPATSPTAASTSSSSR